MPTFNGPQGEPGSFMGTPDFFSDNEGIREIDVTIYDDYPIYLMENRNLTVATRPTPTPQTEQLPVVNSYNSPT